MLHYLEQEARKAREPQSATIIENVSRRQFVGGVLAASGLVLAVRISSASALEPLKPYKTGGLTMPDGYGMAHDPHVYVAIAPDGGVTIVAHRSEMGTGIRTSLPLVIADDDLVVAGAAVEVVVTPVSGDLGAPSGLVVVADDHVLTVVAAQTIVAAVLGDGRGRHHVPDDRVVAVTA